MVFRTPLARRGGILLAVVSLAGIFVWRFFICPVGISREGFDRILTGMSQQEVEAILGRPPVPSSNFGAPVFKVLDGTHVLEDVIINACGGAHVRIFLRLPTDVDYRHLRLQAWESDDATILVIFREDESVVAKEFFRNNDTPNLLERVKQWLGW
jgi:hypothetical protein